MSGGRSKRDCGRAGFLASESLSSPAGEGLGLLLRELSEFLEPTPRRGALGSSPPGVSTPLSSAIGARPSRTAGMSIGVGTWVGSATGTAAAAAAASAFARVRAGKGSALPGGRGTEETVLAPFVGNSGKSDGVRITPAALAAESDLGGALACSTVLGGALPAPALAKATLTALATAFGSAAGLGRTAAFGASTILGRGGGLSSLPLSSLGARYCPGLPAGAESSLGTTGAPVSWLGLAAAAKRLLTRAAAAAGEILGAGLGAGPEELDAGEPLGAGLGAGPGELDDYDDETAPREACGLRGSDDDSEARAGGPSEDPDPEAMVPVNEPNDLTPS